MTRTDRLNHPDHTLDAARLRAWLTHETNRRRLAQAGMAGAGTAWLGASGGAAAQTPVATPGTPRIGGHLVTNAIDGVIDSLDPANPTSGSTLFPSMLIFDQLIRMSADGLSVEPSLASSWEVADDGLSWTFHLRETTFHDGSPVTANDVVFSLERAAAGFLGMWFPVVTFLAPDSATLVIELDQPWSSLEGALTQPLAGILPRKLVEADTAFFEHPIGTGPFKIESWDPQSQLVLVRHEGYWDAPKPYLDRLTLRVIVDRAMRLGELESGALDLALMFPWGHFEQAQTLPGITAFSARLCGHWFYPIPVTVPPFDDVLLRRAMNHAIDREAMAATIFRGTNDPATNFLPPPIAYRDGAVSGFPYDPDRARELVAQSAGKDGFEAILRYDLSNIGSIVPGKEMAESVAAQLNAIGGTVEAVEGDAPAKEVRAEAPNMWFWGWSSWTQQPIDFSLVLARGDINFTTYSYYNEEAISLFYEAQNSLVPTQREDAWMRLQAVLQEDAPYLFLVYDAMVGAAKESVRNFVWSPTGAMRFWETWLDQE